MRFVRASVHVVTKQANQYRGDNERQVQNNKRERVKQDDRKFIRLANKDCENTQTSEKLTAITRNRQQAKDKRCQSSNEDCSSNEGLNGEANR